MTSHSIYYTSTPIMYFVELLRSTAIRSVGVKFVQGIENISAQVKRRLIFVLSLIIFLGGVYDCQSGSTGPIDRELVNDDEKDNTTELGRVTGLQVELGNTQIILFWNTVDNAVGYNIYRGEEKIGEDDPTTKDLTYTDTELINGQEYSYRVSATANDGTEGPKSELIKGIPLGAPSAPMNLMSRPESQEVTLTWDAVNDVSYYRVYRNGLRIAGNITETTYIDTGLTNDIPYSYQVSAVLTVGSCFSCRAESPKTGSISVTPAMRIEGAPFITSIQPAGDGSLTLNWDTVDGAGHYKVYRGDTSDNITLAADNVTENTYTDMGLTNGQAYHYQVSAVNRGGIEGPRSSIVQGIPLPDAPSKPANLMSQPNNQEITLTWDMVTGASYYRVYRDNSQVANNITVNTYTDTGLTNGTSYRYQVSAVINAGSCSSCQVESERSNPLRVAPRRQRPISSLVSGTKIDPLKYVNTLIATGTTIRVSGTAIGGNHETNNPEGAHYPFGMTTFTPLNSLNTYDDGDSIWGAIRPLDALCLSKT